MSDLKPCPFCGGEAKRFTIGDDEPNNAGGDVIVCTRCQACSRVEFGRKENLVDGWNTRTPDPRITQLEAANAQLEADRVELVERAASAWRKVQQANAVGDPHGFSFHARELTATLSRIGEDGK